MKLKLFVRSREEAIIIPSMFTIFLRKEEGIYLRS